MGNSAKPPGTTRAHTLAIDVLAPPDFVFALLHTPSAIRAWWSASRAIVIAEERGSWAAAWGADEDRPDYVTSATIAVFEPPRRMVLGDYRYAARTGPLPFRAEFTTEFNVAPTRDGSRLTVTQSGFPVAPAADDFYRACEKGWQETLESIRRHVAARRDA